MGFGRQQHFQQQQQVFQPAQQFGQFGQRQFAPQQHGRNYQVTPQYAGNFQPQQSGLGYGNPASGYQSIHSFGAAGKKGWKAKHFKALASNQHEILGTDDSNPEDDYQL